MADTSVAITAGSGTPIRVLSGLGAASADQQVVTLADDQGTLVKAQPTGALSTDAGATPVLVDYCDNSPNYFTQNSTGTAYPALTQNTTEGNYWSFDAVGTTASANGYMTQNGITTVPVPPGSAPLEYSFLVKLDTNATLLNNRRWWGPGLYQNSLPSNPGAVSTGVGFELDPTDGKLYASIYAAASGAAGVAETKIQLTKPTDGAYHRYAVFVSKSVVYWQIDGITVATQANPILMYPSTWKGPFLLSFNSSTAPSSTPTMHVSQIAVFDHARSAQGISDGTNPFTRATVKPGGLNPQSTDNILVVGMSPIAPLPPGSNAIGSINLIDSGNVTKATVKASNTASATTDTALVVTQHPTSGTIVASGSPGALNAVADGVTLLDGYASLRVVVAGTFVGTLTFQFSQDGTNWYSPPLGLYSTLNVTTVNTTATGVWQGAVQGRYFRAQMTSYTSGAATVSIAYSVALPALQGAVLFGGNTTIGSIASISTSMVPGTAATNLGKAQAATPGTTDTGVAPLYVRAPTTPVARTATAGNYSLGMVDTEGKLIVQQYADPANTWQAIATQATTTAGVVKAAAAAGIRNYVTGLTVSNSSATPTLVTLLDGATVMWQTWLAAGASVTTPFETPLRGTAATAVNVNLSVAATSVFVAAQGYLGV